MRRRHLGILDRGNSKGEAIFKAFSFKYLQQSLHCSGCCILYSHHVIFCIMVQLMLRCVCVADALRCLSALSAVAVSRCRVTSLSGRMCTMSRRAIVFRRCCSSESTLRSGCRATPTWSAWLAKFFLMRMKLFEHHNMDAYRTTHGITFLVKSRQSATRKSLPCGRSSGLVLFWVLRSSR